MYEPNDWIPAFGRAHGAPTDLVQPVQAHRVLTAKAALLQSVCTAEVLAGQIDRLMSAFGLTHVRIGILPARRPLPHLLPHGFWIVDDETRFESVAGERRTTDPDKVALYRKLADWLWLVAIEGDDARALLLRILDAVKSGG